MAMAPAPLCVLVTRLVILFVHLGFCKALDGCFTEEPAQMSCGWTGACSLEGCEGVCLPVFRPTVADKLGGLLGARAVVALQCEVFASIVLNSIDETSPEQTRKLHNKSLLKRLLRGADSKVLGSLFPEWNRIIRGSSQLGLGTDHRTSTEVPAQARTRRLLEQPMRLRQQGCPTSEQFDMAADKMRQDASAGHWWANSFADDIVASSPGILMLKSVWDRIMNAEALKTMMLDECQSAVVSTDPLKETYYEVQVENFEDTFETSWTGGVPDSLQVCRPKDFSDTEYISDYTTMLVTCAESRGQVANGTCMKEAVVGHFHTPCAESWWQLTGASNEQQSDLMLNFNALRDDCTGLSQEVCEGTRLQATEDAIAQLLGQVAARNLEGLNPPMLMPPPPASPMPPMAMTTPGNMTPPETNTTTTNSTHPVASSGSETGWKAVSTLVAALAFMALQF